jgi:ubiquinone/menaquinone biosynthesis C-methylase UbiE
MPTLTTDADSARDAYEALADAYDLLTAGYCHDRWLDQLERLALSHGLQGNRLLDVACGTGKSFLPLAHRGYAVTGCDISPRMVARAAAKAPQAELFVADMRALPDLGEFDLVTCIDDAVNYLTAPHEVRDALEGMRRCLAPGGVLVWDVNTLAMYRTAFAGDWVTEEGGTMVAWRGRADAACPPESLVEAIVDVFEYHDGSWERATGVHRERHWPVASMAALAEAAGLEVLGLYGQHRGAVIEPGVDELVHTKAVFVAGRDDTQREGVRA